jgi:hypothetical protein
LCNPALPPLPHITAADRQDFPYIDSSPSCHDGERVAYTQAPAARAQPFSRADAALLCRIDLVLVVLSVAPASRLCAACASGPPACLAFHTSLCPLGLCKRSSSRRALDLHGHQPREPSRQVSSRDRACGKRADLLGSPTNTRVPPIAPEHQRYPHAVPQTTLAPFSLALTSGPSRSLQDSAPSSQPPLPSLRQDSAVAHRIDSVKEAASSLPSSVLAFSYFHPATLSARQSNHTSRPIAHPTGPSSPRSPASEPRSNQAPLETGPQSLKRTHSQSLSSGPHVSAESARSPEHVGGFYESGSKHTLSSPISDQTNGSLGNNRHQRYNVRFNPVYTSENMPPNQRPRSDLLPTLPITTETNQPQTPAPEQTVRPSVEPAVTVPVQSPHEQPQPQPRGDNGPKQERCAGCSEVWRRPLPGQPIYRVSSPARDMRDQVQMQENFITRLTNHTKMAEEAYANWLRKHRWCSTENAPSAPSPPATEVPAKSRSRSVEEPPRTDAHSQTSSVNKRKSDVPHDASKYRKVTFDTPSNGTPHIHPAAPA